MLDYDNIKCNGTFKEFMFSIYKEVKRHLPNTYRLDIVFDHKSFIPSEPYALSAHIRLYLCGIYHSFSFCESEFKDTKLINLVKCRFIDWFYSIEYMREEWFKVLKYFDKNWQTPNCQ